MIRFLLFLGILLFLFNQITPYLYRLLPNDYVRTRLIWSTLNNPEELEKPCDFDPFGQTGLAPFGYNMIDPLKSWCWGSILFYPFKISRFS